MESEHALSKAYDSKAVEDAIYHEWETSGAFNPDTLPGERKEPFAIMMPPPNVTGVLHLGHALENTLIDTMVRFQRMRGKKAFIVPGTDHAALPTQAKVEKILMQEGMVNPRKELGREKLVAKIREFAEQSQSTILSQVKKMGTSCDWSRLAFTFDEARSKAVFELFRRMYDDGLIYRGSRVVNWSVKGQSTCSDDEVVHVERPSKLYTFKYSHDFPIAISSTRPETKLGDTAVAVHPSDERYREYVGKIFHVDVGAHAPLEIKIIADEHVDPKFGTGALGVTPAHSPIDFEMYEKQKAKGDPIALVSVIGADGMMTEAAGSGYAGLTVEAAREKFVSWLREQGLLEKEEEILQSVGTSERFGDVIEAIPMLQWWLDMNKQIPGRGQTLKDLMREAVQDISISPDRFKKLYLDRVDHLRDWCLSRQIWWGHRIPVWYHGDEMKVSEDSPGEGWEQDPDTLDTWFSSGTWTFSTLGWPNATKDLEMFHPTSWIQMGYEILYLWMMRMILMSSYALKQIPFHEVYIHGMLRDEFGKKFSKSAGNNIDPLEVIEKHGCDALRWSVLIGTTPGNDSRFYWDKVEGARNLVNKLWNISRYILSVIGTERDSSTPQGVAQNDMRAKTLSDHWILSRLNTVVMNVTKKIAKSEFSSAGEELRDFTWGDLADWYLEIAKFEKGKEAMLRHVLETILKLWHPFMPFVTESLWKGLQTESKPAHLLIVSDWPVAAEPSPDAHERVEHFELVRTLVTAIRRLRAERGIEAAKKIDAGLVVGTYAVTPIRESEKLIMHLARLSSFSFFHTQDSVPAGWTTVVDGPFIIGLNLPEQSEQEQEKIRQDLQEAQAYASSLTQKLSNQEFTAKAPPQVVADMKKKKEEAEAKIIALQARVSEKKEVGYLE